MKTSLNVSFTTTPPNHKVTHTQQILVQETQTYLKKLETQWLGWTWLQIQTWIPQPKPKYKNVKLKLVHIATFYQIALSNTYTVAKIEPQ